MLCHFCVFVVVPKAEDCAFDEEAGNLQSDNFGRGGKGNDPMYVYVQDVRSRNDAKHIPSPDGEGAFTLWDYFRMSSRPASLVKFGIPW